MTIKMRALTFVLINWRFDDCHDEIVGMIMQVIACGIQN